jgi:hypothetical protein
MKSYASPNPRGDVERQQDAVYTENSGAKIVSTIVEQRI